MDNFDLKKYLSNNPLLNEIKVNTPGYMLFPEKYMDDLNTVAEFYLESSSGPDDILNPEGETYTPEAYEDSDADDEQFIAYQNIVNNLQPRIYLIKDWLHYISLPPGAPENSYNTKITITPKKEIRIETPAPDLEDGGYTGWFDSRGNYHPDLKHFDEEGNRK